MIRFAKFSLLLVVREHSAGSLRACRESQNHYVRRPGGTGACQGTQGFAVNSGGAVVGKTIDAA